MKRFLTAVFIVGMTAASFAGPFDSEILGLLSKLQAMSHGDVTPAEWDAVQSELGDVERRARGAGDWDAVVQIRAVEAMVYADMRRDIGRALAVIEGAKREFGSRKIPSVKRLYVQQADYYSRMGDAVAVRRVIDEFRANPNYDPHEYGYMVGEGRNTPVTLVRPTARSTDSVSVTAMEQAAARARFAPGNLFPAFTLRDSRGVTFDLADYRGKVVLIDFWQKDWTPWVRGLPYQVRMHERYHAVGFEIIGISLDRDSGAAASFAGQNGMAWRQVYGDRALARELGIFGEAKNFLVDRNGVILGTNLRGASLAEALQSALAPR